MNRGPGPIRRELEKTLQKYEEIGKLGASKIKAVVTSLQLERDQLKLERDTLKTELGLFSKLFAF